MSQNDERRVLNRTGARLMTEKECEQVPGGFLRTAPCTIIAPPKGGGCVSTDGDCEPPIGC